MCTKFQVDWTSTSSKTTSPKNFNLKWDGRTDERTNERTDGRTNGRTEERTDKRTDEWTHRPENIIPINGALKT